jgi:hypothetical protein
MMKTAITGRLITSCFGAVLPVVLSYALIGEVHPKTRDLIVERPSDLPEQARIPGESCFLYWNGSGATYLYVEQQHGTRLAVFNVTDPGKIRLAYLAALDVTGPFDFVQPLGVQAELVRFRDGQGFGALDLRRTKSPAITRITSIPASVSTEVLGSGVLLVANQPYKEARTVPQDYQVVDMTVPSDGVVLATVKQVNYKVVNGETGTTFLLGSEGLSVIRRISVENEYKTYSTQ